jgi:hypothetical protein
MLAVRAGETRAAVLAAQLQGVRRTAFGISMEVIEISACATSTKRAVSESQAAKTPL